MPYAPKSEQQAAESEKMEGKCSSETSVDLQQTTLRYTPEDIYKTLHNHRCENLQSSINSSICLRDVNSSIWMYVSINKLHYK
jgi:hypothetical protein